MNSQPFENWTALLQFIGDATEEELKEALQTELDTKRRASYVFRLYGKVSYLRSRREKLEMISTINKDL